MVRSARFTLLKIINVKLKIIPLIQRQAGNAILKRFSRAPGYYDTRATSRKETRARNTFLKRNIRFKSSMIASCLNTIVDVYNTILEQTGRLKLKDLLQRVCPLILHIMNIMIHDFMMTLSSRVFYQVINR